MKQNIKITLENTLIVLLAASSFVMFTLSFFPLLTVASDVRLALQMSSLVQRAFSLILFITSTQLWKRKHAPWLLTEVIFLLSLLHSLFSHAQPMQPFLAAADLIFFVLFFLVREDFCCPSAPGSRRRVFFFMLMSLLGVLLNAGLEYHSAKLYLGDGESPLMESLFAGAAAIFGAGNPFPSSHRALELLIFWFSWGCILAALLYWVRPFLHAGKRQPSDTQHARTLLLLYGQNPCSYLALEEDKLLYFGRQADGVIPYGISGSTVVVNGDPICAPEDFPVLLAEFKEFCQKSAHNLFFLSITQRFLEEYKRQGFGYVKCGEEARFHLADYSLAGKPGAKMRMNINHAAKAGVTVEEYHILSQRDPEVEQELLRVSSQWLSQKKSGLLTFTMGGIGLDNPMDKRYFYARNKDGKIVAFIVFVPFLGRDGYMADVTRHGTDAPSGVMEKIMYEAFQAFLKEGVSYASLGVAPLAGLDKNQGSMVERLLHLAYEHLNDAYGFRDLYQAKERYNPTSWEPAYYAYLPKIPTPEMFYAIIKIQNPQGIFDYVKGFLRERIKRERAERNSAHGKKVS